MTQENTDTRETFDAFRVVGDPSALFDALAAAQGQFPSLEKGKSADVVLKDNKGRYTFDYADLSAIQKALRPMLSANGLSVIQPFFDCGQGLIIRTILAGHGARLEADTYVSREGRIQELGSAITYLKRYQYKAILGFEPDGEDDDGNKADGNTATVAPAQRRTQPTPPVPPKPAAPKQAPVASKPASVPPQAIPPSVSEPLERAREVLAEAEASVGVAPAIAEPEPSKLDDSDAPDDGPLVKGSPTASELKVECLRLGMNTATPEGAEAFIKFCVSQVKKSPRDEPLTYGDARRLLAAAKQHATVKP